MKVTSPTEQGKVDMRTTVRRSYLTHWQPRPHLARIGRKAGGTAVAC